MRPPADSIDASRRRLLAGGALGLLGLGMSALLPRASAASARSRLILLGTAGGPTPKSLRAAPANVIVIGDRSYVVDCGNGVARQLALAGVGLGTLRHVFITHHHSDHNADLGNLLLLAWSGPLGHAVDCWGPPPLARMREDFLRLNDFDIQTRIKDEGRPPLDALYRAHEIQAAGPVLDDGIVKVRAAQVVHPPITQAYAYRFDCPDRSIVFSGDTAPSEALIDLARGADVLVHEVMYLPALEKLIASEPNATRLRQHLVDSHTTTAQVGRIAREAGVKTLVLTHFVPGGDKTLSDTLWRDQVRPHFKGEIVVGRDLMVL